MMEKKDKQRILLLDIEENPLTVLLQVSSAEAYRIDQIHKLLIQVLEMTQTRTNLYQRQLTKFRVCLVKSTQS